MKKYAIQTGWMDEFPKIPEFKGDVEIITKNDKSAHFVIQQTIKKHYVLCEIVEEISAKNLGGELGRIANCFNPQLN